MQNLSDVSELPRLAGGLPQSLAEPVDSAFEEKERRVFKRRGQSGLGGSADLGGSNVETLCDPGCVGKILIGASAEFAHNEIHRGQERQPNSWFINHDRGAIAIPWRHRHHRPAGQTLPEIRGNIVAAQKRFQKPDPLTEFPVHVDCGTREVTIRQHSHAADQD